MLSHDGGFVMYREGSSHLLFMDPEGVERVDHSLILCKGQWRIS